MSPRDIFIAVSLVSIANGFLSPFLILGIGLALQWLPGALAGVPQVALFVASLFVSFGTLLLSGVPAALFERATSRRETDRASMLIWLAGAVVLTIPGLQGLARML
jgi:hypothetical protein